MHCCCYLTSGLPQHVSSLSLCSDYARFNKASGVAAHAQLDYLLSLEYVFSSYFPMGRSQSLTLIHSFCQSFPCEKSNCHTVSVYYLWKDIFFLEILPILIWVHPIYWINSIINSLVCYSFILFLIIYLNISQPASFLNAYHRYRHHNHIYKQ